MRRGEISRCPTQNLNLLINLLIRRFAAASPAACSQSSRNGSRPQPRPFHPRVQRREVDPEIVRDLGQLKRPGRDSMRPGQHHPGIPSGAAWP